MKNRKIKKRWYTALALIISMKLSVSTDRPHFNLCCLYFYQNSCALNKKEYGFYVMQCELFISSLYNELFTGELCDEKL